MIRVFKTADQLIKYVAEHYPNDRTNDEQTSAMDDSVWFVCIQEASAVSDSFSTKDIADLFLSGIKPYKDDPIQSIQGWLDTINCDLLEAIKDGDVEDVGDEIDDEVAEEYGVIDVVDLMKGHFGDDN